VSPWRSALREERNLPDSVRGPVECWALARLIWARVRGERAGDDIFGSWYSDITGGGCGRGWEAVDY
jgi:hypothetical protein